MPNKNPIKLGFAGTPMVAFNHFSHIKKNNDFSIDFILTHAEKKVGRGQKKSVESHFQSVKNLNLFKPEDLLWPRPIFFSAWVRTKSMEKSLFLLM